MRKFIADLHIHSRFSIATSKELSFPLLAAWAQIKGINVLATGDFTHPKWRKEMTELLCYDEKSGLYTLREGSSLPLDEVLPGLNMVPGQKHALDSDRSLRFMLQGEISSIYKRGGKSRRVHNLVFMPDLETANKFCQKLEAVGNIASDGRPILGLDSRDLLEMVLEAHPKAFLIPAHIWTPWFSLFGSKSGFDSVEECYGDLSEHIFAMETGLSSDPDMNRLLSALDPYRMISNSDAHSGENLAREANVFAGKIHYDSILQALKEPEKSADTKFMGTFEFFPEEGKYHGDGHRKCELSLSPEETLKHKGICPVCQKALTVGVLYRVMELADRKKPVHKDNRSFKSLVPLREIIGEIYNIGPKSKKVRARYIETLDRFGSELNILTETPVEDLSRFFPPLGEGISRMRRGEVHVKSGYDGEFGTVKMFTEKEQKDIMHGLRSSPRSGREQTKNLSLLKEEDMPKKESKSRKKLAKNAKKNESEDSKDDREKAEAPIKNTFPRNLKSTDMPINDSFMTKKNDQPIERLAEQLTEQLAEQPAGQLAENTTEFSAAKNTGHELSKTDKPHKAKKLSKADKKKKPAEERPKNLSQKKTAAEQKLNPLQEKALEAGPEAVLIIAGPGTGKTSTLIARIARLIKKGAFPKSILAVTFTRKAASEIDASLLQTFGPGLNLPTADTLHALALDLWHRTHSDVPVLLSEDSSFQVFCEANPEENKENLKKIWRQLSLARETLSPLPDEYSLMASQYLAHKSAWNLADYTDLLEFWLEQARSEIFKASWEHVLVDEIQDLSPLQLELLRELLPPSGRGFFGIGDPNQSIYTLRGASPTDCLEFFKKSWPDLILIELEENYRSKKEIVATANALMQDEEAGSPKIKSSIEGNAYIHVFKAPTDSSENIWIAERVASLLGGSSYPIADIAKATLELPLSQGEYSPGDIAILVRTHALGRPIRKALSRIGIPVSEPKPDAFWSDPRVLLVIRSACRLLGIDLAHEEDEKTPECPDKVLAKGPLGMAAYLSTVPPFDEVFWLSRPFRDLIKAYDESGGWAELLTWIHLQTELELVSAKSKKVQILSLHAAKGLEFPIVFMPCLEEGIIPFAGPMLSGRLEKDNAVNISEEQRLFYVGLTRAKDAIFLSHATKRKVFGAEVRLKPSRFLEKLPRDLATTSTLISHKLHQQKQLKLF